MKNIKHLFKISALLLIAIVLFSCNNAAEEYCPDTYEITNKDVQYDENTFVSKELGLKVANNFYMKLNKQAESHLKGNKTRSNDFSMVETISENGLVLMYLVNYSDSGFVIVSATKDFYPILAYSDESNLDLNNNIYGIDEWLEDTKHEIKTCSQKCDSVKAKNHNLWNMDSTTLNRTKFEKTRSGSLSDADIACYIRCEQYLDQYGYGGDEGWHFTPLSDAKQVFEEKGFASIYQNLCYSAEFNHSTISNTVLGYKICTIKNKVGPLLSTKWHQRSPFNDLCDGSPAGCGAIAVAQVMKYYKHPQTFSYNGFAFDWNTIPDIPSATSSQSALVKLVANAIDTHFESSYSWATPGSIEDGLDLLGYNVSTGDDDCHRVRTEIMSGKRPVIMLGNDDNWSFLPGNLKYIGDSHYWVCDGADERTVNKLYLFTEWQPYGKGNFVPGWNSIDSPYDYGGQSYTYYHINWGWGGTSNGWFADVSNSKEGYYDNTYSGPNDPNTQQGHYEHSRKNFYISIKH